MAKLLHPKATAVWLVDNTTMTFKQIADLVGMHELEIQGIADGDVAAGVKGFDPVANNQLEQSEITAAENNPLHKLKIKPNSAASGEEKRRGPRYTPLSKRQDRPNAILWLVRNHPELKDAQISRLAGTTKNTIAQIRDRTHWNSANLTPMDPVSLGLCSQIDLDMEVEKAAKNRPAMEPAAQGETLMPAEQTQTFAGDLNTPAEPVENDMDKEYDADSVFASLSSLKGDEDEAGEENS